MINYSNITESKTITSYPEMDEKLRRINLIREGKRNVENVKTYATIQMLILDEEGKRVKEDLMQYQQENSQEFNISRMDVSNIVPKELVLERLQQTKVFTEIARNSNNELLLKIRETEIQLQAITAKTIALNQKQEEMAQLIGQNNHNPIGLQILQYAEKGGTAYLSSLNT
ncbi:MAG: hypothetical protein H0U27_14795 [Nitrosopumilus sp.]|nr:hypothetical protein [Nitrosopumilus sp.]